MRYAVVIHHDEGSSYGVSIPDIPGCFSGGETEEEAFSSAHEAVLLHLEGIVADGEPIPQIQPIEAHLDNEDYQGGVWGMVDVDMEQISARSSQ